MTNLKQTKRALLTSAVSLLLCFVMLLGSTYAWFTDSAVSKGNKIQAGKLDVELHLWTAADASENIGDNNAPIFGVNDGKAPLVQKAQNNAKDTLWEPGKTQTVYLSIKNTGNLDLKYMVAIEVTDVKKDLDQYMEYAITPDAKFGQAISWAGGEKVVLGTNATDANDVALKAGEEHFFALSVHMNEDATNEQMEGSITFDLKVLAGQLASEADSIGTNYDEFAGYPGLGYAPINGEDQGIQIRDEEGAKTASFTFPAESLDPNADKVEVSIDVKEETGKYVFEIDVEGLVEGNTTPVKVEVRIPAGLDSSKIELYHYEEPITQFTYNPISGYVIFETTSFSPFTVKFDPDSKVDYDANLPENIPTATVTNVSDEYAGEGKFEWNTIAFGDVAEDQQLDAVFKFLAPHNSDNIAEAGGYANWACDYVVSIDRDIKANSIVLGGNYGGYLWVGFANPEAITANEEIYLLGSVSTNPWTYEMIATQVGEFLCGVAESNNEVTDLDGATFTVRLRLTNPETEEHFDVNVVTYKFGTGEITGVSTNE